MGLKKFVSRAYKIGSLFLLFTVVTLLSFMPSKKEESSKNAFFEWNTKITHADIGGGGGGGGSCGGCGDCSSGCGSCGSSDTSSSCASGSSDGGGGDSGGGGGSK